MNAKKKPAPEEKPQSTTGMLADILDDLTVLRRRVTHARVGHYGVDMKAFNMTPVQKALNDAEVALKAAIAETLTA